VATVEAPERVGIARRGCRQEFRVLPAHDRYLPATHRSCHPVVSLSLPPSLAGWGAPDDGRQMPPRASGAPPQARALEIVVAFTLHRVRRRPLDNGAGCR
jgi:hypothetical protein